MLDVYISCTVCPWERALRFSTPRLEELRVLEARVKRNARSQIAMSGSPSITSRTLMRRISEERSEEASKLARMLSTSQEAI